MVGRTATSLTQVEAKRHLSHRGKAQQAGTSLVKMPMPPGQILSARQSHRRGYVKRLSVKRRHKDALLSAARSAEHLRLGMDIA